MGVFNIFQTHCFWHIVTMMTNADTYTTDMPVSIGAFRKQIVLPHWFVNKKGLHMLAYYVQ